MRYFLAIIFVSAFLLSCEKKELPIPKRPVVVRDTTDTISHPGQLLSMEIEMGSDYKNQIWFSLNQGKVVQTNDRGEWDITFECAPGGNHVMLNGAKGMRAYKTNYTSLEEVVDTLG